MGFVLGVDGKSCEDIDECTDGSAVCEAYCNNSPGTYSCSCEAGYILSTDGYRCLDIDECAVSNGNCDQICINEDGWYTCDCYPGYQLTAGNSNASGCIDIDECIQSTSGCTQTCSNSDGSFECGCNAGFDLDTDAKTCIDIDDCEHVTCEHGGSCQDEVESYTCFCSAGYTDMHCETDLNECELVNGGCQDICTNTEGSFNCTCAEGRNLEPDGLSCTGGESDSRTVFQRLEIPRQLLPKACFTVSLVRCTDGEDIDIYLTSTSEWYTLMSDADTMFTLGIVFVKVNDFSVPLSLRGIEVTNLNAGFQLNYGVQYDSSQGMVINNHLTSADCQPFELAEGDFFDFISVDSFTKSFLLSLFPALPDWLSFEKSSTEILSVQDTKSDLVYGRDMDNDNWCAGAPVIHSHLYTVFRFGTGFSLSVMGSRVAIPKPLKSRKFCLIVDLCHSNGGTVFLMVPDESRDLLLQLPIFRVLKEEQNLHIHPRGIGISLVNGINADYHSLSVDLWNGDMMFQPVLPQVDFWIGGALLKYDEYFTVSANADIYLGVPSIQTMLTSMFREEWTGLIAIQLTASPILRFKLLGKEYSISFPLLTAAFNAVISVGGSDRQWCGDVSNPPGVFLSTMLELNPFKGVPILEDWVVSNTHRLYAFVTSDPRDHLLDGINVDLAEDILQLGSCLKSAIAIVDNAINSIDIELSNASKAIVTELQESVIAVKDVIGVNIADILSGDFKELMIYLSDIRQHFLQIRAIVYTFADETEFIVNEAKDNFTDLLHTQINIIDENVHSVINTITENAITTVGNYTGFGLKYTTDLKLFGLKFLGIDIEIVYSEGNLFQCSRFDKIQELLNGENVLRFTGRASTGYNIGKFLKFETGFGIGGAIAIDSKDIVVVQLEAFISFIGIGATCDVFISSSGIYTYLEVNIWDIFLVQLDVSAEVVDEWYQLKYTVHGRFVTKARKRRYDQTSTSLIHDGYLDAFKVARKRRQVQTVSSSFQASYLDALKRVIRLISDEAQKRLTQVQNTLTAAQNGLTKAQNWIDEKQAEVRKANVAFDNAVQVLEDGKAKLETAKGPLKAVIRKLDESQRKVDNLCRIRSCSKWCIPGIKCKICWTGGWIKFPYPCCRFTKCMISFPNPLCVLANLACRILRAIAYGILELAKIFVRVAMLAFDIAQAVVAVAQFIVDKSRVVLLIAEGFLELATIGLEFAKVILEAAKVALEAVKFIIGVAVQVLEFVIEYGLKSIIDVRNCGFNIELSTIDLPIFEVFCDLDAFRLGWTTIKLKINFKNILQSLWQAARATIGALMDIVGGIFSGRKRRDITFEASSRMHVLLRKIRESNGLNNSDTYWNETIDIVNNITGLRDTDTDSDNRIQLYREKCNTITVIQDFMQVAFESLQDIANESKAYLYEIDDVKSQLQSYGNSSTENITVESAGISREYAAKDYNMTDDDLDKAINDTKAAAIDDPLLIEIQAATNVSMENVDAEARSVESVDYVSYWFASMKNMTRDFFNETECEDFKDCVFYSISSLYNLYESEVLPNITDIQDSILDLENILIEAFQNESSSILDTSIAMEYVLTQINRLVDMNLFCSEPPQFLKQLQNQTVLTGSDVIFYCHVSADPEPSFFWVRNDDVISGEHSNMLVIANVSEADTVDKYNCIAGNVVANVTSTDAYITVVSEDDDECETDNGNCTHVCSNTIGSYVCTCYNGYGIEEDGVSCSDVNECEEDNGGCHQQCHNYIGTFNCSCQSGFTLHADLHNCTDINECIQDNGGCKQHCNNADGTFNCSCDDGYILQEDTISCVDVNECSTDNGGCDHTCTNGNGSFQCTCKDGYTLQDDGVSCVDINECNTDNGGCDHTCTNGNGSFQCSCRIGYKLEDDAVSCGDINECDARNGDCDHICMNEEGSFRCRCKIGYTLQDDRMMCVDDNECNTDNGGCGHTCTNEDGPYKCSCNDGYRLDTDSVSCTDIDECVSDGAGCEHTCLNFIGNFSCICNAGYVLDVDSVSCSELKQHKLSPSVKLDVPLPNLAYYATYKKTVDDVRQMLERHIMKYTDAQITVFVNRIRNGSIIADYTVIYDDEGNKTGTADAIVQSIAALSVGENLEYNGKLVHTTSMLPENVSDPCDIRELLLAPCAEGFYCKADTDGPQCREMKVDSADNGNYIEFITHIIGIFGVICAAVMLLLCTILIQRYRQSAVKDRHSRETTRVPTNGGLPGAAVHNAQESQLVLQPEAGWDACPVNTVESCLLGSIDVGNAFSSTNSKKSARRYAPESI